MILNIILLLVLLFCAVFFISIGLWLAFKWELGFKIAQAISLIACLVSFIVIVSVVVYGFIFLSQ